jgi:small subunit ribosomal protein S21
MNKKQKQHKTTVPGNSSAVKVLGTTKEDLGYALKTWKRKIKSSGVLEKVKDNKTYEKPSVVRRAQLISARYLQHVKDLHRN